MAGPSLYVAGHNDHAQLGTGSVFDVHTPTQIESINPKKVATGGEFTFILDIDGKLWSSGINSYGQLGLGDKTQRSRYTKISDTLWSDVSCSKNLVIALSEYGYMFMSGLQLDNITESTTFTQIGTKRWKQVSCSDTHILAIDQNNNLFGYGFNKYGQLGLGNNTDVFSDFVQIGTDEWLKVCAANNFSAGIKINNKLFTTGNNAFGQLGIGTYEDVNAFTEIVFDENSEINNFIEISVNDNKLLVIRNDNQLFVSGQNGYFIRNVIFEIETQTILLNEQANIQVLNVVYSEELNIFCGILKNSVTGVQYIATSENHMSWTIQEPILSSIGIWTNPKISWAPEISTFCVVSGSSESMTLTSQDGINWELHTPFTDGGWRSVCWSPELNKFCAVASTYAGISEDGLVWDIYEISARNYMSVCWSSELGIFCALNNGSTNSVATSTDGINWTIQTNPNNGREWASLCWSPELHLFCAVAKYGTGRIMTSPDGINWTIQTNASDDQWYAVCWSKELGIFCVIAQNGSLSSSVTISSDGINWTRIPTSSYFSNAYTSIAWSPKLSLFIALSTNNIYAYSSDGITWGYRTYSTSNNWTAITWSSELELFCAVGSGKLMTSADGVTWITQAPASGNNWTSVCWAPTIEKLCAVSNNGINNRSMVSSNAINWVSYIPPKYISAAPWKSIVWSPELKLFFAVGGGSTGYWTSSPDGINWENKSSSLIYYPENVCWSPELKLFCIIGSRNFAISSDGINLNFMSAPSNMKWSKLVWAKSISKFVAIADGFGTSGVADFAAISSNGTNWEIVPTGSNNAWKDITWSPELGMFCAIPSNNNLTFMFSYDGFIWERTIVPINQYWQSINWNAQLGKFIALSSTGSSARIITSTNGINWSIVNAEPFVLQNTWSAICWASEISLYCAVANGGASYRIMISTDGVAWEAIEPPDISLSFSCVCWSGELGLFVAAGSTSESIQYIITSEDGRLWQRQQVPNSNNITALCWSSELELFCAVTNTGSDDRVLTSPDGIIWTARTAAAPNNWIDVCWSSELRVFCAIAPTDETYPRIMTSIDGIDWVHHSGPSAGSLSSICWSPEKQLFVTTNSNITTNSGVCLVSKDGINWEASIYYFENLWKKLIWSDKFEMFLLFASNQYSVSRNNFLPYQIIGSLDGKVWKPVFDNYNLANSISYNDAIYIDSLDSIFAVGAPTIGVGPYEDNYNPNSAIITYEDTSVDHGGSIGLGEAKDVLSVNKLTSPISSEKAIAIGGGELCSYLINEQQELYFTGTDVVYPENESFFKKQVSKTGWCNVVAEHDGVYLTYSIEEYIPPVKPDPDPTIPIEPPLVDEPYVMESDHENYIPIYIHDNTKEFLHRGVIVNPITAEYLENLDFEKTLSFETILDKKAVAMIDENSLLTCRGQIFDISSFTKQATSENLYLVNISSNHISYRLTDISYIKSITKGPYWILNEIVKETEGSLGTGFEGKVISINSDNEPRIEIYNGGSNYVAGEVIKVVGMTSNLSTYLTILQTDQGRVVSLRLGTIEERDRMLPEYPWRSGIMLQQWTSGDGKGLILYINYVSGISYQGFENIESKFINNNRDSKPIKYSIRARGDKYKLGDQVIIGDTESLSPETHRRRLASATVSKIKNVWIVNKDGTYSLKPFRFNNEPDPVEDENGDPIIYAGAAETLSDFITGVSIPDVIEDVEYPDQNELSDDKTTNFFFSGTLTEIVKEILYNTEFNIVGTVPGFDGKVTFTSNAENIKALLLDFIEWMHSTGYSQSDIVFDNYYVRFIQINYNDYQFLYNSNKIKSMSYLLDKTEKDTFDEYKMEYSFSPIIFDYNLKLTNNVRLINDDLKIDKILRISGFRFNPYDLFDCEVIVSNLMKKRNILGSSIRTPEKLKKEISQSIIQSDNNTNQNEVNGMEGEDVGGVYDPGGAGDPPPGGDGSGSGEFPTFSPEEAGYHLVVDEDGSVIAKAVPNIIIEDHIPTVTETNAYPLDTIVFVYDPTQIIEPTPDPEPEV